MSETFTLPRDITAVIDKFTPEEAQRAFEGATEYIGELMEYYNGPDKDQELGREEIAQAEQVVSYINSKHPDVKIEQ